MSRQYMSQTELGKRFGVTSHVIGRWLADIGLKTGYGPTDRAKSESYVSTAPNGRDTGAFYVWHTEKTLKTLEEAGHKRLDKGTPLIGPFTSTMCENGRFEIRGSDGQTNLWVRGRENAETIIELLNFARNHYRRLG